MQDQQKIWKSQLLHFSYRVNLEGRYNLYIWYREI